MRAAKWGNMPKNRRLAILSFLTALALVPLPAAAETVTKFNLGVGVGSDFITAFVAKDEGFFEKHGLDVTVSTVVNSALIPLDCRISSVCLVSASWMPNTRPAPTPVSNARDRP